MPILNEMSVISWLSLYIEFHTIQANVNQTDQKNSDMIIYSHKSNDK